MIRYCWDFDWWAGCVGYDWWWAFIPAVVVWLALVLSDAARKRRRHRG